MSTTYLDKAQVPAFLRAGYTGNRFRAIACETVSIPSDAGLWSNGSRDTYNALNFSLGASASLPGQSSAPWDSTRSDRSVSLKPGFAIVKHSTFCGKDMGLTFYVHPADIAALLPSDKASDLSEREIKVLAIIGGLKSAYRSDEYSRKGYSSAEIDAIKDKLLSLGLIDKRGAITTQGKNARGNVMPY